MAKKKKGTRRRRLKGILTKAGALLMGVTPPAVSAVEAGAFAMNPQLRDLPIGDKILLFGTRLVNNLTAGFVGKDVFPEIRLSGQAGAMQVGNGWKVGEEQGLPWLITTATGAVMVGVDAIIGKITKSANKIGGVTITGN